MPIFGELERLPVVGYTIVYEDERVALSGDTAPPRRLDKEAEGCDLAVSESHITRWINFTNPSDDYSGDQARQDCQQLHVGSETLVNLF